MLNSNIKSSVTNKKNKLTGIQIGRGIAALAVVITHSIEHPLRGVFDHAQFFGRYGVTLFFVISGYIMVISTGPTTFDPLRFLRNRVRRVVPLYWVATIFTAALTLIMPNVFKATQFDLTYLVKSLLFVPEYSPGDGTIRPFVKLGWTLNFEMFFYICFAALFGLSLKLRAAGISIIFAILIASGHIFDFKHPILVFYTRIDTLGFAAGVWIAVYTQRINSPSKKLLLSLFLVSALTIIGIIISYKVYEDNPWTQVFLIFACALQVLILAEIKQLGWPSPKILQLAGDASYSIYLFHMFGVGFSTVILLKLFPSFLIPTIFIAIISGTILGILVYFYIEAPLNKIFAKPHQNMGPIAPQASEEPTPAKKLC